MSPFTRAFTKMVWIYMIAMVVAESAKAAGDLISVAQGVSTAWSYLLSSLGYALTYGLTAILLGLFAKTLRLWNRVPDPDQMLLTGLLGCLVIAYGVHSFYYYGWTYLYNSAMKGGPKGLVNQPMAYLFRGIAELCIGVYWLRMASEYFRTPGSPGFLDRLRIAEIMITEDTDVP